MCEDTNNRSRESNWKLISKDYAIPVLLIWKTAQQLCSVYGER